MSSYIDTLKPDQKEAIRLMKISMVKNGITSEYMQAAIIAIVSKESNMTPKSEGGYGGTSNERIRKIFGSRVKDLSEDELSALKKDNEAFFNKVYGGRNGNGPNEGFKYRGRGLNQLTFKGNYQAMKQYTDADIVGDPDLVNTMPVAVDVLMGYFLKNFKSKSNKLDEYGMTDMNSAKTPEDAVNAAYHANAGWGKTKAEVQSDKTGGRQRALSRVDDLITYVKTIDVNAPAPNKDGHNETPNPTPTPTGNTISKSVGDGGTNNKADVLVVQELLNKKGASLVVDGDCGKKTIAAIKDFQTKSGISASGVVNPNDATFKALTGTVTPTPTPIPTPTGKTISKSVGNGGTNAKADALVVQELLNKNGASLVVDGDCGKKTIAAIKDFQTKNNIEASGLINPGDATMNALNGVKADSGSISQAFLDEIARLNAALADYFKKMQAAPHDTTEKEGMVQSIMDYFKNILK